MDEGTVRMLAGVESEVAQRVEVEVRLAGMIAENNERQAAGQAMAYPEQEFIDLASEAQAIAARLREY